MYINNRKSLEVEYAKISDICISYVKFYGNVGM